MICFYDHRHVYSIDHGSEWYRYSVIGVTVCACGLRYGQARKKVWDCVSG